jgi:hypothetical protein
MSLSAVDQVAINAASNNGEDGPTAIESVMTTRGDAGRAIWGDSAAAASPGANEGVYAITMHGSFNDQKWGSGGFFDSPPRTFDTLTVVVDQDTGTVVDVNLRNGTVDLSSLGALTQLPSPNQGVLLGQIASNQARATRASRNVTATVLQRTVATARVKSDGQFRMVLHSGTYTRRIGGGCTTTVGGIDVTHSSTRNVRIRSR